jgi:hypothetical protein
MERRREMPLLRYFVFVGGALLVLLFVSDAYFPKVPDQVRADSELPVIRIHSDRKWPERIVFDTNRPTIVPAAAANTIASAQVPAVAGEASAQARVRDSFAQLQPPEQKRAQLTEPKKPEKPVQRKRTIARRHVPPPVMLVAQQPQQFSLFGNGTW